MQPGVAVLRDRGPERRNVDAVRGVGPDATERIAAEAGNVQRLGDASMRGGRRVGAQPPAGLAKPLLPDRGTERRATRHQHGHQIGHRGPGHEKSAGALWKAEQLPRPIDDLPLDLDRRMVAAAQIGVQSGRQHLGKHADHCAAAMHPAHEAGMDVARGVGNDELVEVAIDVGEIGRSARQLAAKAPPCRLGHRLPDRAVADAGDVIDHVVEHAVPLRTQLVPVLRVQRRRRPRQMIDARGGAHAARSAAAAARLAIMAANAAKIFCICGGL